ncbi:MAG: GspE/PulE family protein [Candidatus Komeilibacteria bacterium]|nr:GspE/PulE family protein [Candidatus Komeilibacteria bacterium]
MLSDNKIKEILKAKSLLDPADLEKHSTQAEAKGLTLENFLLSTNIITEDVLYNGVAGFFNLPFVNLRDKTIAKEVLFLIPEPIASKYEVIAFDKNDTGLDLAVTDPEDMQTIEFIKRKVNLGLTLHVATPAAIRETVKQYHQNLETELASIRTKTGGKLSANLADNPAAKSGINLEDLAKDLPIVRVVDTLLEYAIFEGASDIHIEPAEKEVIVRYRVDGILREVMELPKNMQDGIVARIKILSNLKLDEHRLPQDGRFKIENKDYKISFRVSMIPVYDGEKVVMRLLDESKKTLTLEQLGLERDVLAAVKSSLSKPNGIILVTGPTGSGKTTTLYTMIDILNTPLVNIATIEDPIEYRMPRVNQSQVNPKIGFTFAGGLRALLRQDPNIIMVGEIRDKETAGIAINAAMTGHLVLSTLHTNDAPTALPRLLDMGIEPFLVSSTTNMILAQRLVRKICKHCATSYNLKPEEVASLEKDHGIDIANIAKKLMTADDADKDLSSILFSKGKGCNKCGNSGYKGRIGIDEVLAMSDEIKSLVNTRSDSDSIRNKAREQGMIIMLEDGFLKAKAGITTIEEILRVTKE